ncbi:DUF7009 family protein [Flagellimonas sp. S174]|uniref:DUF7009 family protein n=1 Tax=Flagellimonas sp. S174 TaxID=3410790 RepID=UPI003BF5DD14
MKIRIKGNTVRFRLTKSEVQKLCETGEVEERTEFDESFFSYSVIASDEQEALHASFSEGRIMLHISNVLLRHWDTNEKVGFYHNQLLANGRELILTLEKDFVCMDQTAEDQSDNYPNPKLM